MRASLVIFLLILSTCVFGQAAPVSPCAGAEFKQLDFWLGDWDASRNASPSGPAGHGSNHITRTTLARPGNVKANRMVFADIAPNSFIWHWQATQDGKNWSDSWVIRYTRKKK